MSVCYAIIFNNYKKVIVGIIDNNITKQDKWSCWKFYNRFNLYEFNLGIRYIYDYKDVLWFIERFNTSYAVTDKTIRNKIYDIKLRMENK